jgi:hypothetical protein
LKSTEVSLNEKKQIVETLHRSLKRAKPILNDRIEVEEDED